MINQVGGAVFQRTAALITPAQLKERYFFGIDLTDKDGKEVPESVLKHHIDAAVSYLEHKLDIIIFPTAFEEAHDYRAVDYQEFNFVSLKHRPVLKVDEIKAKYSPNRDLILYPKEWYIVEKEAGQVQLTPVEGSMNSMVISQTGSAMPILFGTKDRWPHLFHIKYTAGFCNDEIPIIINEMVGLAAAASVFEILGDLVLRPGISGESVGIDGASVNSQTNANGPFSGRLKAYKTKLDEYLKVAHKYYNGFAFSVP